MQQPQAHMKVPPHDIDAEQAVLGSCLLKNEGVAEAVNEVMAEDFYRPAHTIIFSAVEKLFNNGKPVDLVTVMNQLKGLGQLEEVGGAAYLSNITSVPSSLNRIKAHCEIVKDKSKARQLIALTNEISAECYQGTNTKDTVDSMGGRFFSIAVDDQKSTKSIGEISKDVCSGIEERRRNKKSLIGVPTGFSDIDRNIHGFLGSELIILAARPAMGKTTLALNFLHNAVEQGYPSLFFSLEMCKEEIGLKHMSLISGIDHDKLQTGRVADGDWPKITRATGVMEKMKLYIDDTAALSITQVRARARMLVARYGIKFIVIDYLGLMKAPGRDKHEQVSEVSAGLKALAKELNVPVLALAQLNRKCEDRTDKRPLLSDLRDSGSIEQDANIVMFIYRDEVYNEADDSPYKGQAEIIVSKFRRGIKKKHTLWFKGEVNRFENYANWSE